MEPGIIAEGVPPEEGKFCADCKHLIGVRHNYKEFNLWRCGHPRNVKDGAPNLITGIRERIFKFQDITILRYSSNETCEINSTKPKILLWLNNEVAEYCGPKGTWYEKYEPPVYEEPEKPKELEVGKGKKAGKYSLDL